jgi:formylglycine-generating enzyme required for sulfatase activity
MRIDTWRLLGPLSLAATLIVGGCAGSTDVVDNGVVDTGNNDIIYTGDGWTGDTPCEPSCSVGQECGSDGCGGTCGPNAGDCTGDKFCDGTSCITNPCPSGFILIPAWTFTMGSAWREPGSETGGADESHHQVTITKPFCMAEAELTNAQWLAITGKNPSYFATAGDTIPVQNISWFDAVAFCNMKSTADGLTPCYELTGETGTFSGGCVAGQIQCGGDFGYETVTRVESCTGYRLPTEAEWELAARAGVSTDPSKYEHLTEWLILKCQADIADIKDVAWYCGNAAATYDTAYDCHDWSPLETCGPQPVKGKTPNAWGLYDMLGNVFEFCQDYYSPFDLADAVDPLLDAPGYNRIIRGGSWSAVAAFARFGSRTAVSPGDRGDIGLRLVMAVPVIEGGAK